MAEAEAALARNRRYLLAGVDEGAVRDAHLAPVARKLERHTFGEKRNGGSG